MKKNTHRNRKLSKLNFSSSSTFCFFEESIFFSTNRFSLIEHFCTLFYRFILLSKEKKRQTLFTCDFSIVALCLSHIGLISKFCSFSLSPCKKNSSIRRSTHLRYNGKGFVGLLRSAQCTKFSSTYNW